MIRRTSLTLNQCQNQAISQQTRSNSMLLHNSSAELERGESEGTINILSIQTQSLKLSPQKPMTWPELTESLEAWQDPEDDLDLEDQVPLASFGHFSPEFAARWEKTLQYESGSGYLEIWVARFEEILRLPQAKKYRETFKQRIGILLDAMVNNPSLRTRCYDKAQDATATCHDGILFSLFEMEIKQFEERMIALESSDEEVRQEIERIFNFYRLQ
ncbi:unnamed protein product [Rotaria sp. Silwood2]|nr:unnamed protein product [Rotaria sp. Silwood2]CAF2637359.1 unnamed protein product [Rotaria sp. Silwood2]CAF3045562.1 unnamed protein product [Rotaria sp. Silwood2]CAF3912347.1 unnamed protein product [Rotaria sp. Silwood2]CAF4136691.1 unnamed protein product [Rotaria sp. Silwood2]